MANATLLQPQGVAAGSFHRGTVALQPVPAASADLLVRGSPEGDARTAPSCRGSCGGAEETA